MKRFWGSILFLMLAAVPLLSYAAGLVPCGGYGEPACQMCYAVELVNRVISWLVLILGTVAAIIIVYAGFKLVTSGGNRHAKEDAKSMISNMIIGYVIVLAGWLLVDTGMKALLIDGETRLGMWNELSCMAQPNPDGASYSPTTFDPNGEIPGNRVVVTPGYTYVTGGTGGSLSGGGAGGGAGGGVQCSASNSACSVAALQSAGLTPVQANVMSCIAMTESSGIPSTPPYNETHPGSNSTACGTFQITRTTWRGNPPPGACNDWRSNCQRAQCNIQTMVRLVRANGYSDWTCPNCNNKAASCVRAYGGRM